MANLFGVPQLDFSALGGLRQEADEQRRREQEAFYRQQAFQQRQAEAGREQAFIKSLADVPQRDGVYDYGEMAARAARAGYLPGVEHFSKLAEAQRTRQEGRVPPGWTRDAQGNLTYIKGGPADPEYVEKVAGAKTKPKEFGFADIGKLTEEGKKYSNITRYVDTFKPEFAGYKSSMIGDAAVLAGRRLPEAVVGKDIARGAEWWADYQASKNVIRNELFGSALTPPEQREFEKADISPGMDPKQIETNLKLQSAIVKNGLKRKANALIAAGYDPVPIAAAYGVDLKELGITAQGRGRGGAAGAQPQPQTQPEYDRPEISEARKLIAEGRLTPENAAKMLRKNNIPFNPRDLELQ